MNLWANWFVSLDNTEKFDFVSEENEIAMFEALGIVIDKSSQ